jgi:hypothetical protein
MLVLNRFVDGRFCWSSFGDGTWQKIPAASSAFHGIKNSDWKSTTWPRIFKHREQRRRR